MQTLVRDSLTLDPFQAVLVGIYRLKMWYFNPEGESRVAKENMDTSFTLRVRYR